MPRSILHAPGNDEYGYEDASERWLPIHTIESILLSVISSAPPSVSRARNAPARMQHAHRNEDGDQRSRSALRFPVALALAVIHDPNVDSPANVDAAKMFRENKAEYRKRVARCVRRSQDA